MRFVVLGAGAIGGSVGALLARAGHDVHLVARGPHGDAIRDQGLRLETPDGTFVIRAPVSSNATWRDGDVLLLAVKTQDAEVALRGVAPEIPVVCLTNGIAAERMSSNNLRSVFGAYVFVPASHLVPGIVQLWASPVAGVIDLGPYPPRAAPLASTIVSVLRSGGFESDLRDDIMRYKRGKLLLNLGNVVEALCGPTAGDLEIEQRARAEGIACFEAAGLDYTIDDTRFVDVKTIGGATRPGGSTWQSLARGKPLEVDFLNGEIVTLGHAHGVPTPANAALQRVASESVERGMPPGALSIAELEAAVRRAG
jgi:2-dehydropantoate 2-reductase